MAYLWASWLPEALRKEGVALILEPGYATRGRYRVDGRRDLPPNWDFEPNGLVTQHHTGVLSSPKNPNPTRNTLVKGRSDLPGPLCHVSTQHDGKVRLIALGRANHAGVHSGAGPTNRGEDGNRYAIGNEIDTNGTQKMPVAQYRAAIRVAAAVVRHKKRDASWMLSHRETSVTGKWDPGEFGKPVDMNKWRRDLAECLSYPPGVWYSKSGTSSWGPVDTAELAKGNKGTNKASIKKMQYRLKRANPKKVAPELRSAVKVNGVWDEATKACLAGWQKVVFAPSTPGVNDGYQGGNRLGGHQAKKLFGARFRLV